LAISGKSQKDEKTKSAQNSDNHGRSPRTKDRSSRGKKQPSNGRLSESSRDKTGKERVRNRGRKNNLHWKRKMSVGTRPMRPKGGRDIGRDGTPLHRRKRAQNHFRAVFVATKEIDQKVRRSLVRIQPFSQEKGRWLAKRGGWSHDRMILSGLGRGSISQNAGGGNPG